MLYTIIQTDIRVPAVEQPCHPRALESHMEAFASHQLRMKRDSVEDFQRDFYGLKVICIMSTHCSRVRINHKPTSTCKGNLENVV